MWPRLSQARSLWRFGAAALLAQRAWPHADGIEGPGADSEARTETVGVA